jgi:cytochrome c biogenesis protein CcmG/thiol:disulfide interchange protein DsbE
MKLLLLSLLAVVAPLAAQPAGRAPLEPQESRKIAPAFALKDAGGKTITLKKYRGKVVLLDFWATWCHGCKEEIPMFGDLQHTYGPKKLVVVGVALDEEGWKTLRPYLNDNHPPYQMVLGNDATAKLYGIESLPDTFLIDRKGRIAASYIARLVDRADVDANIRAIIERK